jgi:hypothetical protein
MQAVATEDSSVFEVKQAPQAIQLPVCGYFMMLYLSGIRRRRWQINMKHWWIGESRKLKCSEKKLSILPNIN